MNLWKRILIAEIDAYQFNSKNYTNRETGVLTKSET